MSTADAFYFYFGFRAFSLHFSWITDKQKNLFKNRLTINSEHILRFYRIEIENIARKREENKIEFQLDFNII